MVRIPHNMVNNSYFPHMSNCNSPGHRCTFFFLTYSQTKVKQKIVDAVQNQCYTHLFSLVLLSYMVIVYSVEIIKDVIEYHDIVIFYTACALYLQIKILFSIAKIKISLVINFAYCYSPSNKLETNN